ncbi:hypothetical protein GCM10010289_14360 [Streptomyces violascens]|nr:hypothetical protein GCM10010289_14360 [Streptomyces violascens]
MPHRHPRRVSGGKRDGPPPGFRGRAIGVRGRYALRRRNVRLRGSSVKAEPYVASADPAA